MDHCIEIRPVQVANLGDVAAVHMRAFPDSALTRLGLEAVRRYYEWLLLGPYDQTVLAAWVNEKIVGFLFGGCFRGAMGGFLKKNALFLALNTLRRPWLVTNAIFRERIRFGFANFHKKTNSCPSNVPVPPANNHKLRFGVLALAVDPAAQGMGIGQALMAAIEQIARVQGFERMSLTVHVDNYQAIRFYEKQGWKRLLTSAGEWKGSMRKELEQKISRPVPSEKVVN
jgi:ribosomal protein S18 acetylase RimI-like enzyme